MARVMIVDFNTNLFKVIKESLEARPGHTVIMGSDGESDETTPVGSPLLHQLLYCKSIDIVKKQLDQQVIDLVYINSVLLQSQQDTWFEELIADSINTKVKIILLVLPFNYRISN